MADIPKEKTVLPGRAVRVTVPASVAFDLGKFQKALGNLAERLGCRPCLSGADCTFQIERDFVINEKSLDVAGAIIIHG